MNKTQNSENLNGINCVTIAGGTGLATLLSGLKKYVVPNTTGKHRVKHLSAIVAVSDDGGSSGRLRDELQMPPSGDIRNCMVALSEDSSLLSKLFQHRFRGLGDLGGHNFGNLFLAALSEITGDFAEAVKLSSEILANKGHIYPTTVSNVRLAAELFDGSIIRGETRIGNVGRAISGFIWNLKIASRCRTLYLLFRMQTLLRSGQVRSLQACFLPCWFRALLRR